MSRLATTAEHRSEEVEVRKSHVTRTTNYTTEETASSSAARNLSHLGGVAASTRSKPEAFVNIGAPGGSTFKRSDLACLHDAIAKNDLTVAQDYLEGRNHCNRVDINVEDEDGYTALHWAALKGHEKAVHFLLNWKPPVDDMQTRVAPTKQIQIHARDKDGWTALHWAAHRNHVGVVQMLIKSGADAKMREWLLERAAWELAKDPSTKRAVLGQPIFVGGDDGNGTENSYGNRIFEPAHKEGVSANRALAEAAALREVAATDGEDPDEETTDMLSAWAPGRGNRR